MSSEEFKNLERMLSMPDLWIFGYGSIVWKHTEVDYVERSHAMVYGFRRRFWQFSPCHRGTKSDPGLVVSLYSVDDWRSLGLSDEKDLWRVNGMAFRVTPKYCRKVVDDLVRRESGGFDIAWLPIYNDKGHVISNHGLTFIAGVDNKNFAGVKTVADIASVVKRAHGPSGSNVEYVEKLSEWLEETGVEDKHVRSVVEAIRGIALLK